MRKKIVIGIQIFLLGVLVYASFATRVFTKTILVERPSKLVMDQVGNTRNLAKWLIPFSNLDTSIHRFEGQLKLTAGEASLEIEKANFLESLVRVSDGKETSKLLFSSMPDSGFSSKLMMSYEATWLQRLLGTNSVVKNGLKSLDDFNDYLNDAKRVYGYKIEMVPVVDTTFLFSQSIVSRSLQKETIGKHYDDLIKHAEMVKAGYNGTRIMYLLKVGSDSISVNTAIAVTNSSIEFEHSEGRFIFKRMPFQKNLLAAYYQGRFDGIEKVYPVLDRFKADFSLRSMAIPFAKIITSGTSFSDDQIVQAIVYYPVY